LIRKIAVLDGRMCSGLIDLELVKEVTMQIDAERDEETDDQLQTLLVCALVKKVPRIVFTTGPELDRLTDENWHTTRKAIEIIQENYRDFIDWKDNENFKEFWKC